MADEIIVKYVADTKKAEQSLNGYISTTEKVGTTTDKTTKKVEKDYSKMAGGVTSSLKSIAGAVGIAFGTQQIIQFGKEAIQLAGRLEGVERAFNRIGDAKLLDGLRAATRGTVSDLVLMQNSVKAHNFGIPLDQMATLLKFAGARARETGEDVDYLVNSIIMGIGRKSPMILDNLGISAIELRKRFNGISVESANVADVAKIVGSIATEELDKMGVQADTTADKIDQLNVKLEHSKTIIGEGLIASLEGAENAFDPFIEALTGTADGLEDVKTKQTVLKSVSVTTEAFIKSQFAAWFALGEQISSVGNILSFVGEKIGLVNEELDNNVIDDWVDDAERATAMLREMGTVTPTVTKNLAYYNELIKKLQADQQAANITRERVRELEDEINKAIEERKILLGQLTEAQKAALKSAEDAAKALKDALILDEDDPFSGLISKLDRYVDETERATSHADDVWNRHFQDLMAGQDEAFENDKKLREQAEQDTRDVFNTTIAAWQSLTQTAASLVQAQYDQQFASLDSALKKEQITREEYDRRKAQLGKEQAKKQKEFAITMAIINTALGVTNAFATAPNIILGAILAAVVAAAGAAEIATIASQPVPQFAEGGWVDSKGKIHGRSHARGGVKIEAEGDEFITKGKYARSNSRLLEAINTGNSERYIYENHVAPIVESILSGGMGAMGDSFKLNSMFNDKNLLKQGDRNRKSERESARFIVDGITKGLNRKSKDRYV
jgi:ABC-type transporter MlaC component